MNYNEFLKDIEKRKGTLDNKRRMLDAAALAGNCARAIYGDENARALAKGFGYQMDIIPPGQIQENPEENPEEIPEENPEEIPENTEV